MATSQLSLPKYNELVYETNANRNNSCVYSTSMAYRGLGIKVAMGGMEVGQRGVINIQLWWGLSLQLDRGPGPECMRGNTYLFILSSFIHTIIRLLK